jgi:pyridoxal phosphate enzyme (YggS family)
MTATPDLAANFAAVHARIAAAAQRAGRDPAAVTLVTVTKGHPPETVAAALAAGATLLGENYVAEALAKIAAFPAASFHMIGHVQSRKAGDVAAHFQMVESVDSEKLARRLSTARADRPPLPILLQCNVSGEASKFGWDAADEARWPEFAAALAPLLDLPGLAIEGLMTMAPLDADPRPTFARLRRLAEFLRPRLGLALPQLSMGMSADFEAAIAEGATLVRLGTILLGPRQPSLR